MSDTVWGDVGGGGAEEQLGYINNTVIGNVTPAAGTFTVLTCSQFVISGLAAGYVKADANGLFSSQAAVPVADISGTLPVESGGTGLVNYAVGDILYCTSVDNLAALGIGTEGQVLTVISGVPSWQTISGTGTVTSVNASGGSTGLTFGGGPITVAGTLTLSGVLIPANGGTGLTTTPSNGQLLIGNGTGYTLATLTAGANITINNTAGGIEIVGTGGGGITGAFVENDQVVSADYTITSGRNAHSVGPITIDTGITVTIPTGSIWKID